MSQRTIAALLAVPLLVGLFVVVGTQPLPYVTYRPGPTLDILATRDGEEIVEVVGEKAYRTNGELRLTTIYVDQPQEEVTLDELMRAWLSPSEAVYPYDSVYAPDETDESNDAASVVQMVSSQDAAIAAALTELGYEVSPDIKVLVVDEDLPAGGVLKPRDVLLEVDGAPIRATTDVVDAVDRAPDGEPVTFLVRRNDRELSLEVTPESAGGDKRIGIELGQGFSFPFKV